VEQRAVSGIDVELPHGDPLMGVMDPACLCCPGHLTAWLAPPPFLAIMASGGRGGLSLLIEKMRGIPNGGAPTALAEAKCRFLQHYPHDWRIFWTSRHQPGKAGVRVVIVVARGVKCMQPRGSHVSSLEVGRKGPLRIPGLNLWSH
jgi:hypothetical protein